MAGFVVFGGTAEGRLIAEAFCNTAVRVEVCVATEYGASLLPAAPNIHVHAGRMDMEEMETFLKRAEIECCVDATHPYAAAVTENLSEVCGRLALPYIRVLRGETGSGTDAEQKRVWLVKNTEEAAEFLSGTVGNILITTGSKELEQYTRIPEYRSRCFARVLPTAEAVEKCRRLGFEGKNLIAMQGPFSEELNYWMLKHTEAAWMVTKSSGAAGGYQEKCEAAVRAGVNILVIERPKEPTALAGARSAGREAGCPAPAVGMELPRAIEYLKQQFRIQNKRKLYLIGMGPGNRELLTCRAAAVLERCDAVLGAPRMLDIWPGCRKKPCFEGYRREEMAAYLHSHPEFREAAIVFSGDIGFYSGAKGIRELLPEYEICPVPGISSPVYFLDRLGIPWEEVRLVSSHGQEPDLLPLIRENERVCTLLGRADFVACLCKRLVEYGLEEIRITVGERLSYPEERIIRGLPRELSESRFDTLSVALFENPAPKAGTVTPGIEDESFIRGRVPMTKQEIRTLSLSQLKLQKDSVLYDIGAGTGSVSIEAALLCGKGRVYAAEKNPDAVSLLYENRKKFCAGNVEIIEGEAPACLKELPAPTHAFIGGSGGNLSEIIRCIRDKNPGTRFVVNAVTLETIAKMEEIRRIFPEYEAMQVIQVNAAKSRPLGRYHLMSAENPVMIFCFGGENNEGQNA